jgi:hypothetical protein
MQPEVAQDACQDVGGNLKENAGRTNDMLHFDISAFTALFEV